MSEPKPQGIREVVQERLKQYGEFIEERALKNGVPDLVQASRDNECPDIIRREIEKGLKNNGG